MKIAIVGGGAIGLLFASYLNRKHEVILLCRREEQVRDLQQHHLTIEAQATKRIEKVYATSKWEEINNVDLIILAVKQYDLQSMMTTFSKNINPQIPLLFLQNGMSHLQLLQTTPYEHIFIGSVEHGVSKMNDYHIQVNGIGKTNLALYRGNNERIYELLDLKDFPFVFMEDYEQVLLRKLIVNAVINPLTALYQVKNGELLHNSYYHRCMSELFTEIIECFPQLNDMMISDIEHICKITKNNQSSMYKDLLAVKKTEIDAIVGYIIEVAKENQKKIPLTTFIYHSIKGIESE